MDAVNHNDDEDLLSRARDGDRRAMQALVERHQQKAHYLALGLLGDRHEAEDATQDAFVKALNSLHKFRGDAKFSSWLHRIVVNTCRDRQRKRRWTWLPFGEATESHLRDQDVAMATPPSPISHTREHGLKQALHQAMQSLTQRERQVFTLRQFQQLSVRETATVLGVAEGSVKALLHRALHKLRADLGGFAPQEENT
ncbi:MAG: hypothetical protein DHS20C11_22310 [Lysobacteraceae bacterium]|nr:MAG: hypothetical protein DHS20C11_22310 [Xanthomonadaceae bacterium]